MNAGIVCNILRDPDKNRPGLFYVCPIVFSQSAGENLRSRCQNSLNVPVYRMQIPFAILTHSCMIKQKTRYDDKRLQQ
jgi:hypothetical protein